MATNWKGGRGGMGGMRGGSGERSSEMEEVGGRIQEPKLEHSKCIARGQWELR